MSDYILVHARTHSFGARFPFPIRATRNQYTLFSDRYNEILPYSDYSVTTGIRVDLPPTVRALILVHPDLQFIQRWNALPQSVEPEPTEDSEITTVHLMPKLRNSSDNLVIIQIGQPIASVTFLHLNRDNLIQGKEILLLPRF
jgi:hypothetical protein